MGAQYWWKYKYWWVVVVGSHTCAVYSITDKEKKMSIYIGKEQWNLWGQGHNVFNLDIDRNEHGIVFSSIALLIREILTIYSADSIKMRNHPHCKDDRCEAHCFKLWLMVLWSGWSRRCVWSSTYIWLCGWVVYIICVTLLCDYWRLRVQLLLVALFLFLLKKLLM